MAYAKRPYRRTTRATTSTMRPRKTITKARKTTKSAFNKRVLAVVNRNSETKMKIIEVFNNQDIHGFGLATATGISPTVPGATNVNILDTMALAQGTEQEQRIGNEVSNCKLRLRGYVFSKAYDANMNSSTLPYEIHMVVYKRKKDYLNPFNNIKSLPNNSVGEIDHTIINSVYPFNKDSFIIKKHRVFRMRPLMAAPSTTSPSNTNSQQSNAPMFQRFQCDININNKLMYADKVNTPANEWVGVLFYVLNGDGSALYDPQNTVWQNRCKVSMDAVLTYKDA